MPTRPVLLLSVACSGPVPEADPQGKDRQNNVDTGIDTGEDDGPQDDWLPPSEAGPYTPATVQDTFEGPEGAVFPVQAWYPTSGSDSALHRYDSLVEGSAVDGGTPVCDRIRPVLLFSHGNGGVRWQSMFLTEHLAARGWVVVAPDHVGNTIFDDGDVSRRALVFRRPLDVAAAFDWLVDTLAAAGGPLAGCVDPDQGYAVAGHSFGGFTTFAVAGAPLRRSTLDGACADGTGWLCREVRQEFEAHPEVDTYDLSDPRTWAAIPLTPAGYEPLSDGLDMIQIPMLVMGGGRDELTPMASQVRPLYDGLTVQPRYLAELPDAGHYTFSDACAYLPTYDDCGPPYLQAEDAHPLIIETVTAFLDVQRGEDRSAAALPPDSPYLRWEADR